MTTYDHDAMLNRMLSCYKVTQVEVFLQILVGLLEFVLLVFQAVWKIKRITLQIGNILL